MTEPQETWLTQKAYDRLQSELKGLIENRPILAAEINERREEGDLKENGGYHAAREQQGQEEARIRQLQELLAMSLLAKPPLSLALLVSVWLSRCTTTAMRMTMRLSCSLRAKKAAEIRIWKPIPQTLLLVKPSWVPRPATLVHTICPMEKPARSL